jgi:asparagine synthetase B (glutamine-hydrolysing)
VDIEVGQVHLAHRRLSILDLSPAGNQPFIDTETGCALVSNGEIYNFRELRIQLENAGYRFHSEGDTEVLIKGYLHWGESVLERLRGMFAFGLWDERKQALWLVRDPYGIKPLYYAYSAAGSRRHRWFYAARQRAGALHLLSRCSFLAGRAQSTDYLEWVGGCDLLCIRGRYLAQYRTQSGTA